MAKLETEATFLSVFWHLAEKGDSRLDAIAAHVEPEMLEFTNIGEAYRILRERHTLGKSVNDFEIGALLRDKLGEDNYDLIHQDHLIGGRILRGYAADILLNWRAREQVKLLRSLAEETERMIGGNDAKAGKVADKGISALVNLHHERMGTKSPHTKEDFIRQEEEWMEQGNANGVPWPWPKLQEQIGDALPGDLISVAAYSNGGKSTVAANLFNHFSISHPVITFPTEMGAPWLSRALAAEASVPQSIAERRQWSLATPEQKARYALARQDFLRREWELVNRRRISPQEIIARASVLRRKYSGKTVVIIVDHMHRLDYGGQEPDLVVGDATQRLRDWAAEDQEGGIILVLLYQPRKPSDELELYKPVMGHQVRGKSNVWNEADIMLSPFRVWVKCDQTGVHRTPWGSPSALWTPEGKLDICKPNDPAGKLDDQHAFIKVVKRRVGGEGPVLTLEIEGPCGRIYEMERRQGGLVAMR